MRTKRQDQLYDIIFEADSPAGKAFDVGLMILIALSVLVVMLESVVQIQHAFPRLLRALEWFFTLVFTIEYGLRLYCAKKPKRYAKSFFGVVDLLSIAPTYISIFVAGGQYLLMVRVLRLLRVFRVLKMAEHYQEAHVIIRALRASREKITVFFFAVCTLVLIIGTLMYLVEPQSFTSIPQAVYWSIVTITTVGYGDVTPVTPLGKLLASIIMLTGYAIIAVPTGIITSELSIQRRTDRPQKGAGKTCPHCGKDTTNRG